MGKSDPFVFSKYSAMLSNIELGNCCFLGFSKHNRLTSSLKVESSSFFDLELENWDINNKCWNIDSNSFDSIVCTRVAYFCKDVESFFSECHRILKPGGHILVDWGLGDHWRFENFKVGWKKDGEQEWCYSNDNFLWSTIWHDDFKNHLEYLKFEKSIQKKGYTTVEKAIYDEVPEIYNISGIFSKFNNIFVDMLHLWDDSPQLYIILLATKVNNEQA